MNFEEIYISLKQRERRLFEFIFDGKAIDMTTIQIAHKVRFSLRTVFKNLNTLERLGLIIRLTGVSGEINQYIVPLQVKEARDKFIDNSLQFVGIR